MIKYLLAIIGLVVAIFVLELLDNTNHIQGFVKVSEPALENSMDTPQKKALYHASK